MKNFILGGVLAIVFIGISYIFGHNPTYLECFLFGMVASLLADDILDD
ncbi:hypothetical protein [Priestia megaterium]